MNIVDTAYHLTFSDETTLPAYACVGKCKKIWWEADFKGRDESVCPLCSGGLTSPTDGVHYKILSSANRKLRLSDFKKFAQISSTEKTNIKSILANGGHISNLSIVKPAFEEKALHEWCS